MNELLGCPCAIARKGNVHAEVAIEPFLFEDEAVLDEVEGRSVRGVFSEEVVFVSHDIIFRSSKEVQGADVGAVLPIGSPKGFPDYSNIPAS